MTIPPDADTCPALVEDLSAIRDAADLIRDADALIIGAGAGMSADSGLGVYQGTNGRYASTTTLHGLTEFELASADIYETHPDAARQHARDRYQTVLAAQPHRGYPILSQWRHRAAAGAVVITTNVDGMFARSGFPETSIYEAHGSAAYSQCLARCGARVFPTTDPAISAAICDRCGGPARPNVNMFADFAFDDQRRAAQWERLSRWFDHTEETAANVVVIELGAGTVVPVVRGKCEALSEANQWPLVRINPDEPDPSSRPATARRVHVRDGANAALRNINELL